MIVADTGAVLALLDADDRHHPALKDLFLRDPDAWVLPWAILPEVDYLLATQVGPPAQDTFFEDVASGAYLVEWGREDDLVRAWALHRQYRDLGLGLVDAAVLALAERLEASAIATLDVRHFAAVELKTRPRLVPRDLGEGERPARPSAVARRRARRPMD